jgi:LysR family glycine cleavage system transcriptional activator
MISRFGARDNLKLLHQPKVFPYKARMAAPSHLKSLQALELAAKTGSFAAAAELLAITPAAVGQRVKALEDYLGVTLLERGRAGISPTAELAKALPQLMAGFASLEAASASLDMGRPQELHIAAIPDFAELWLQPRLGAFRAAHPNIRFCINGEGDAPIRLARVDCEIGFGPSDGDCETLFHDLLIPVVSPANAERMGRLDPETRLEGFPLLHPDFYKDDPIMSSWPRWLAANGVERTAPDRGMRFRRVAGLIDAVAADAGIALCGLALLSEAVDDGRIVPAYPASTGCETGHAFTARYRQQTSPNRALEQFRTWLREEAGQTSDWLADFRHGGRG